MNSRGRGSYKPKFSSRRIEQPHPWPTTNSFVNPHQMRQNQRNVQSAIERRERTQKQDQMKRTLAQMLNLSLNEVEMLLGETAMTGEKKTEGKQSKTFTKHKDKYKSACQKYLTTLKVIENDNFGILGRVKKLKKRILDKLSHIQTVTVYYSTVYPMLIFSLSEGKNQLQTKYKHLREILSEIPSLRHKKDLIDDIFGRLYDRVDPKYYCLAIFAVDKAQELKIKVNEKNYLTESEENTVMFFYRIGPNKEINFVIFDQFLRSIEFDSIFIQKCREKHRQQFSKFEEMYEIVFGLKKNEQDESNDLFEREQIQSDEQDRETSGQESLLNVKIELERYLQKDLSDLEEEIERLEEEIQEQSTKDSSSEKMLRLTEKLEDIEENRANYEEIRDKVKRQIMFGDNQIYKIGLKKLIIAQKQLESKLPIVAKKRQIFQKLKKENLIIIEGETGSGKSTQLPQILCEYYQLFDNPNAKPVLVTQPRRLATRSLAERVAKEMGENVGRFVDYVASAGRTVNPKAKIIFKLDRLVLDELTEDPLLSKYSCLVIDQAHQRTISIDVILGLIKELLQKRKDFKVIVTSASMDIQLFQTYFKTKTLRVSGRMFPVTISYKDYHNFREGDRFQMVKKIQKLIDEEILHDFNSMKIQFKGHLLCFCSGVQQINELVKIFSRKLNLNVFTVLPLHGKISPAEQRKVFQLTGKHKFIFASRIAETAITIDGVRVVIDPGQDIELVYDQKYKISTMKLIEISQSSAKQRAGRSGRTAPGHCFRLYTEESYKKRKVCKVPEMENSSLQIVVLRLKSLKIRDVIDFPYISKPSTDGLKNSLELLSLIGALSGKDQQITKIGQILIRIPIDPFLSRAIVEGIIYQRILYNPQYSHFLQGIPENQLIEVKEKGLIYTITVTLSLLINFSNLFFIRADDREKGESVKFAQFSDEEGDFFFLKNIYQKYLNFKRNIKYQTSNLFKNAQNYELREWLTKNFLNFKTLKQAEELVEEISKIINSFKIDQIYYKEEVKKACEKVGKCKSFREMVLSCLITSFSPNLCKYSGNPHIGYTLVNQRRPVQIYGTSNLSLLGIEADWIICYDLYTNEVGRLYCKVAHKVSFEFIQNHTDKFIQEVFNIQKIQQQNPFYLQLKYPLPTSILTQIRAQFNKGQRDQQLNFLQYTYPVFNQQLNQVTFFILVDKQANSQVLQKMQVNLSTDSIVLKLKEYVQSKSQVVHDSFRHNYIGNIYVSLQDGFQISKIEFNRRQYTVDVVSIDLMIEYLVETFSQIGRSQVYVVDSKDKILKQFHEFNYSNAYKRATFFGLDEEDKDNFYEVIEGLKITNPDIPVNYSIKLVDYRKKVPRTKLLLYFFAGSNYSSKGNTLYMSYQTGAKEMFDLLQVAVAKLNVRSSRLGLLGRSSTLEGKTAIYSIHASKLKLSKKQNGINLFDSSCDEFEMREYLTEMVKTNNLDFRFKFPKNITKFRDPDPSQAPKSDAVWRKQISSILEENGIPTDKLIINVKGYYIPPRNTKLSQFQKTFRVYMTSELLGFDYNYLSKLKNAIDGKQRILGSEKVHVRAYYDQVIAIPSRKLFEALEQEYFHQLTMFKAESPLLMFDTIIRRIKNCDRTMIVAHSPNKQDFIKPQRILSALYTPKLIKLQGHQFTFLDKMQEGKTLLDNLQFEYKYKIYFGFEKANKNLKVYCESNQLKQIQARIKQSIKDFQYYCEKISYRGKNLNSVLQILNAEMEQRSEQGGFIYSILFQTREIQITANMTVFEKVKNALLKLSASEKGECQICADVLRSPYKFINCSCVFCWHCISQYVRLFFNSQQMVLCCPSEKCLNLKTPININDFKTLLPEEQFQKICDLKVKKYLEEHSKQTQCFICKLCQNIIDKSDLGNEVTMGCDVCGRSWCQECLKEAHLGYTCKEWALSGELSEDQLKKMGIKQCPNCKNGIEKSGGCNHMACKKCDTHICWKCLKAFKTQEECYNHLAKVCGGIFDNVVIDQ